MLHWFPVQSVGLLHRFGRFVALVSSVRVSVWLKVEKTKLMLTPKMAIFDWKLISFFGLVFGRFTAPVSLAG